MARRRRTTRKTYITNNYRGPRRYGILNFLFDILMICLTAGLWLIWIFIREMRNR